MKIREGAYYRTRGGHVIGPLRAVSWCDRTFSALDLTWHEDGSYVQGVPGNLDLISEVYVSDTPPGVKYTEAQLREMMRDPRYWRTREPEFVKRVTEGFRALVGGGAPPADVPAPEAKSLRDEFAGRALTGMMADHTAPDKPPEFFADLAYKYANAMMEARKK
jgi:hypothetical protein